MARTRENNLTHANSHHLRPTCPQRPPETTTCKVSGAGCHHLAPWSWTTCHDLPNATQPTQAPTTDNLPPNVIKALENLLPKAETEAAPSGWSTPEPSRVGEK